MYNNKSTSTTQHREKKMSHSKYKKLSVNSLLPTIFHLILLPLIPHFFSFMKKQQQRNGIMWIITFPNKQYFFPLSLLFIFHVVVYSVDVRALRFHDGFETNVLRRMRQEQKKKLKWKKKISCPFSPPSRSVLLFRSHTLVYLLRFFFSLTQHPHTTPHHFESFSRPRSLHFFFFFP
jgi:hypothetical protein